LNKQHITKYNQAGQTPTLPGFLFVVVQNSAIENTPEQHLFFSFFLKLFSEIG